MRGLARGSTSVPPHLSRIGSVLPQGHAVGDRGRSVEHAARGDAFVSEHVTAAERERCSLALRALGRRPLRATCLRRSLVLASLLRRHRPALRVGVTKSGGAVAAHAWLEIDGATLDPEAAQYRGLAPVRAAGERR